MNYFLASLGSAVTGFVAGALFMRVWSIRHGWKGWKGPKMRHSEPWEVTTGASDRTVTLPTLADNLGREIVLKIDSGAGEVVIRSGRRQVKWRDLLGRASDAVWNSSWLLPALFVIFLPVLIVAALVFLALSPLFEEDRRDRD